MRLPSLLAPLLFIGFFTATLTACKTAPTAAGGTVPAAPASSASPSRPTANLATRAAATKANLAIEKVRLTELFRGTPVVFVLQADGSLRVEVPLSFSFDAGQAVVKPPLAAVLDRVATGQRDELTRVVVSAPPDAANKGSTLPVDRSASVQHYLTTRGLAEARLGSAPAGGASVVRLVISEMPQP